MYICVYIYIYIYIYIHIYIFGLQLGQYFFKSTFANVVPVGSLTPY